MKTLEYACDSKANAAAFPTRYFYQLRFFLVSPPFIRISAIYPDPFLAVVKKETVVSVDSYRHVCPLKRKTGRTSVTITVYDLLIS